MMMMMMMMIRPFFFIALAAAAAIASSSASGEGEDQCVYTVYVRTGSVIKGGTDAKIGLTIGDAAGLRVQLSPDIQSWGGLMGPDHDYFERGSLDAFSGRGPCGLSPPLCSLNVTSDGGGAHHGWFCESVEVTATGPHVPCAQTLFYVRQWLATDAPPYQLYATVDGCDHQQQQSQSHFVIERNQGRIRSSAHSSAAAAAIM